MPLASSDAPDEAPTGTPRGTPFDWTDSTYFALDMDAGQGSADGRLYDFMEWESRDMITMLQRDHRAKTVELALTLPLLAAKGSIKPAKGDKGEAADMQQRLQTPVESGGMETPLSMVIAQMTSASVHKRAYFEKEYRIDPDGKTGYQGLWWRPQSTCRLRFDGNTGRRIGFEQDQFILVNGGTKWQKERPGMPVRIPEELSLVHLHGQYREPLTGTSDLEIPYWCWKTKAKIMFLWYTYLEGKALPFSHVHPTGGADDGEARRVALRVAAVKNSGVVSTSGEIAIDTMNAAGDGGQQFLDAIKYLDSASANSVLAGFVDLASAAGSGKGSMALSEDQSDFFLQSRQADAQEIANTVTHQIIAPLVQYNFGSKAAFPTWEFEPLSEQDRAPVITMLTALMSSASPNAQAAIPAAFYDQLVVEGARILNMDESLIDADLKSASHLALVKAAQAKLSAPAVGVAQTAAVVGRATQQVQRAQRGQNPIVGGKP